MKSAGSLRILRCLALFLAGWLSVYPSDAQGVRLHFVKQIGVGWDTDKWGWMSYVAFSADGTKVAGDAATSSSDVAGDLTLWSFPTGKLVGKLPATHGVLSPDWSYAATSGGVIEVASGRKVISIPHGEGDFSTIEFSPDSRFIAYFSTTSGENGNDRRGIRVLELATLKQVAEFGRRPPQAMAISPDGLTLAAGYWDTVILWNVKTGERRASLHGFGRYVDAISFSRDGKLIGTGTDLGGLQVWDVAGRKRLSSTSLEGQYVSAPAFSPDGNLVAVGTYGTGTVFLVDARTGKVLDSQRISDIGCGSVAFSPDGRYLIAPSTGGLVKWPYDRGGTIRVFEVSGSQ